jgi:hypothetical protein
MSDVILERVKFHAHEGNLPCAAAHMTAWETSATPAKVGAVADKAGIPIVYCQIGLFGYGSKAEGKSKLIRPMETIPADLEAKVRARVKEGRYITCRACWEIAAEMDIERLTVGNAADSLGFKIKSCQLGAF